MSKFRSPRRRPVRQRSGYKASGETTGGECKLKKASMIYVNSTSLKLTFEKAPVELVQSFNRNLAFVAFGGYIFPSTDIRLTAVIKYVGDDGFKISSNMKRLLPNNKWGKFGVHCIFDMRKIEKPRGKLYSELNLRSDTKIERLDFFGFNLGTVYYYYDKDLWDIFNQKTLIYLPEIYYFDSEEPFSVRPKEYDKMSFSDGRCAVLKSCNRCKRYLPIDIENERNTISFSNHCVSRAPCKHPLFSSYKVVENECENLPDYILKKRDLSDIKQRSLLPNKNVISKVKTYYGYQLECRTCKKYYVNAPLNPLRNSTQHREDSLRRRALEVLVDTLLDRKWVYFDFRLKHREEFDVYIWERFGKKCFNCGKKLESPKDMALDHTMPLSMLWPLDETATCLCYTCNSQKRDKFPVDFYPEDKLDKLAEITGLDKEVIHSRKINMKALLALKNKIVWFFDVFLMEPDYQKIRRGKRTADLIYKAVQDAIKASGINLDLIAEYKKRTNRMPKSISVKP